MRGTSFLAGLIAILLISGCSTPPEPVRYVNKAKGFSIEYPGDWEREEGFLGTAVKALRPGGGKGFRESFNVVVEDIPPAASTLDSYMEATLERMAKVLQGFEWLESGTAYIDRREARWMVFTHRMGSLHFKVLSYTLFGERRAYVITCTSKTGEFDDYRTTFETIAYSFKFE